MYKTDKQDDTEYERCEKCKYNTSKYDLDILLKVFDNENTDVAIADSTGKYIVVSDSYLTHNGIKKEDVIGKTAVSLEKQGVFYPSVAAICYRNKRKSTVLQKNWMGNKILTTAVPIFDDYGGLKYIVCYNSIDIAEFTTTQEKFDRIKEMMRQYDISLNQLKLESMEVSELVSRSKSMSQIISLINQVADTKANIVITGETGVGKSMIAKVIHDKSSRKSRAFVEINCSTIPDTLIESELFGYESGSFTGANSNGKIGKIEFANGGTLFLDEVCDMPIDMQSNLLGVIQNKKIMRIGGTKNIDVDFRLIAATNKDMEKEVKEGRFREDLYYRLNVIPIHIPPIRERVEDIFPLVMAFLNKFNTYYDKEVVIAEEAMDMLEQQYWPGNIRQIENLIERMVILSRDEIVTIKDFPKDLNLVAAADSVEQIGLFETLEAYEKHIIIKAYEKYKTSIKVAEVLKISQPTAIRRLHKYILDYSE